MKELDKKVYFRFYEELNDFLPKEKRKKTFEHKYSDKASVKDMIESLGIPHTEIDLILVNGVSVDFNYIVNNNDRISVYPVFESIDISGLQHLRAEPLRKPKFVLDVHLGKLAKLMRLAGFDTFYKNDYDDGTIVKISIEQHRTILTRDTGLLKRKEITHGYFIRNIKAEKQLEEVITRFDLAKFIKPFTRCLICNTELRPVAKENVINRIPPKVKKYQTEFSVCESCDKIYWKGTHYERMLKILQPYKNPGKP